MNFENNEIVIRLSKIKIFLMFICSLAFVAGGLLFTMAPPEGRYSKYYLFAVGIVAVIFFGMCAFSFLKKFFNKKPGIVINYEGITDNSGGFSGGFVPWADITAVEAVQSRQTANQKIILIFVRNPQDYINAGASFLARKMKSLNYKYYGTPLSISSNGLQIKFETLYAILLAQYVKYKLQSTAKPLCSKADLP